jgi:hypothetical protein
MKQKRQLAVLVVLLLIAGVIWLFYFDRDKPIVTAGAPAQNPPLLSVENPILHNDGVDRARKTEYKSGGRNIFSRELPRPQQPPRIPKPNDGDKPVPQIPVTPTVSPLPVKFFGYGTIPNGTARVAFFSDGEEVYIVQEGQLLLRRFRILRIGNANLEYEEVSSGLRGTANLEEQAAPSQ